jgi:hypothetical protein
MLERFIEETEPARFDLEEWRAQFQTTADEPETARISQKDPGSHLDRGRRCDAHGPSTIPGTR